MGILLAVILILYMNYTTCQGTFKAAVVNFKPERNPSFIPPEVIVRNIELYKKCMQKAKEDGANIIIFPQYGLTTPEPHTSGKVQLLTYSTKVPAPEENFNFCNNRSESNVLVNISCPANSYQMVTVVSLIERDEKNFYKSIVVFDKTGNLIRRYRSQTLENGEPYDTGNETVTFTVDNIKFGLLTVSDVFNSTVVNNLLAHNPQTIIVTSAFPVPHLFSGLSVAAGFARKLRKKNVNLLFSNLLWTEEDIKLGNTAGSGIFLQDGNKYHYMFLPDINDKQYILEDIVITRKSEKIEEVTTGNIPKITINDVNKNISQNLSLDPTTDSSTARNCEGNICCTVKVKSDVAVNDYYRLYFEISDNKTLKCGLISLVVSNEIIKEVTLTLKHEESQEKLDPLVLASDSSLKPIIDIQERSEVGSFEISANSINNLLNFGLLWDIPISAPAEPTSVVVIVTITIFVILLVILLLAIVIKYRRNIIERFQKS